MSRVSISKNNQAISDINSAISKYEDAISKISATNNNKKAQGIISLIDSCIASLSGANSKIGNINSQIEVELAKAEEADRLKKKQEEEGEEDGC